MATFLGGCVYSTQALAKKAKVLLKEKYGEEFAIQENSVAAGALYSSTYHCIAYPVNNPKLKGDIRCFVTDDKNIVEEYGKLADENITVVADMNYLLSGIKKQEFTINNGCIEY